MRKKTAAIVTGFMITLGMLGGCGSAGDSTGNANASGENHLNFGCYVYSTSFDPAAYQNASWQGMRWGITETLYRFNDDSTIRPWLSDSYEVSEDHKTWTFHIRDGVKFSNGNPCDAQAVADSMNRLFEVCNRIQFHTQTVHRYGKH